GEPYEAVGRRPAGEARRIAGAVAVHHGDEGDAGRRGDQNADDPLFETIEDAVQQLEQDVPPRLGVRARTLCPPRFLPRDSRGRTRLVQDCGATKPEAL